MSKSPYISSPNIMLSPKYSVLSVALDYGQKAVLRAGTPMSAAGAVANDGTAVGILLYDCHKSLGVTVGQVVIAGYIDKAVAAANSQIAVSAAAKAAMKNIVFSNDVGFEPVALPEIDAETDIGKVLGVDEDGAMSLLPAPMPMPEIDPEADVGKVLTVTEDGDLSLLPLPDPEPVEYIRLKSSTEGSEKIFKLTVDDDGELTATEEVEPEPEEDPETEPGE